MRKNFFGIFSSVKSSGLFSRESEQLNPKLGEFFGAHNQPSIGPFVYNLLVSKFIHLINTKPNYQNRGRLDLGENKDLQYSESEIKAILQLYFNREDADCSVLFLTGHASPEGNYMVWAKEGEVPINLQTITSLWNNRTSKGRNRELLLILDFCFSGSWVFANQSPDIIIQSCCNNKEKAKDFRIGENVIGSIFLHNLLMLHGHSDCFYEGVNQTPSCSFLKGDQLDRIRNTYELILMHKNWDDFKYVFKDKVRSFSRDGIIFEGTPVEVRVSTSEFRGPPLDFRGPPMGMPFGGPPPERGVNVDLGRSGMTITSSTITSSGGGREEVTKKSYQTSGSSGNTGSYMFKFGMN